MATNPEATGLARVQAAKQALARATTTEEVLHIHTIARQLEAAAKVVAKSANVPLRLDLDELRVLSERRLGELLQQQKETVGLNTGVRMRGRTVGGSVVESPRDDRPTLAEYGIDPKLSARAQKYARIPLDEFEQKRREWRYCQENGEPPMKLHRVMLAPDTPHTPLIEPPRVSCWLTVGCADETDQIALAQRLRLEGRSVRCSKG